MLPRTCLAASPLPVPSDLARHLLLRIILREHDAASYGLRKFFPVGTMGEGGGIAYVGIELLSRAPARYFLRGRGAIS
jgi:hypothetical protein